MVGHYAIKSIALIDFIDVPDIAIAIAVPFLTGTTGQQKFYFQSFTEIIKVRGRWRCASDCGFKSGNPMHPGGR
jgi:hypothetical protein